MSVRYRPARCSAATWTTYLQAAADARAAGADVDLEPLLRLDEMDDDQAAKTIDAVYRHILCG
ncbi:hypothetical protein J0910_29885 [Nocardiopsis sp. CNT-189]|uniref:hypothetical protein n=1 Tax=Nocardiopsis oceanisediminis TaxID=2816862 RepID=UPI003B394BF1